MKAFVGIPYVNRPDLLKDALDSVPEEYPIVVINNSGVALELPPEVRGVEIVTPVVPLTFTQTMNAYQAKALAVDVDCWFFMHSDAKATADDFSRIALMAKSGQAEGVNWAVVYSLYDVLCLFSVAACTRIGPWDTIFPQYFADNDYYRRMVLNKYIRLEAGGGTVVHQNGGSQTLHSDPVRERANKYLFPALEQYYGEKWGGTPGNEVFITPWNGRP